jgi:hypothetical protein
MLPFGNVMVYFWLGVDSVQARAQPRERLVLGADYAVRDRSLPDPDTATELDGNFPERRAGPVYDSATLRPRRFLHPAPSGGFILPRWL